MARASMPGKGMASGPPGARRKASLFSPPATLRQALYGLVHQSPLSVEQQAEELTLSPQYVYNAANPNLDGDGPHYQLRHLVPHTKITGNYCVLDFIERQLGRVAVPVSTGPSLSPEAAHLDLLALTKDLGQVAATLEAALRDGRLSVAESRQLRQELWHLVTDAVALYHAIPEEEEGV